MPQRIQCPHCEATYAYSSAIRGRSYSCTHCEKSFAVGNELVATAGLQNSGFPPLATLIPPPLPAARIRPAKMPRLRTSIDSKPKYSSGGLALFSLIGIFMFGFSIVATGIGYTMWPSAPPAPIPATTTMELPQSLPADVERPKNLNEILKDPPPGGAGKQRPGQFPNPGFNEFEPAKPDRWQPLPSRKL